MKHKCPDCDAVFSCNEKNCQVPYQITCRHQGDGWN
uniref:ORF39 n=1 Tax=Nitrosopumilaceae spindle-shaped virus TaxID=3065433 RepID=A0AAT9J743_9VIRU